MDWRRAARSSRDLWLALVLAFPSALAAQVATAAVVRGEVRDSAGWPVVGARVATGLVGADLPYIVSYPDSHWRAQLGLRFEF